jgi:hypothetical protein
MARNSAIPLWFCLIVVATEYTLERVIQYKVARDEKFMEHYSAHCEISLTNFFRRRIIQTVLERAINGK